MSTMLFKKLSTKLARSSIHYMILDHEPFLRRIYNSRVGQYFFCSNSILAKIARYFKDQFKVRYQVKRLPLLHDLGFVERAIHDMEKVAINSSCKSEKLLLNWALSVCHVNKNNTYSLEKGLDYLSVVLDKDKNKERIKSAAVLKSEALTRLGRIYESLEFTRQALHKFPCNNIRLALSNIYAKSLDELDYSTRERMRLSLVNEVLQAYQLEKIDLLSADHDFTLDNLYVPECIAGQKENGPLVTVIMPVYNAQSFIATALSSLISQTWLNLEIIVVDDASTDNTCVIVNNFQEKDDRIKLLHNNVNSGPYVARNLALGQASGELVTVNDADDWAHPRKIEIQARHLLENPDIIANMSRCSRVSSNMVFCRRANPGFYIAKNMSSLMFRREPVLRKAGFWDSVRFGADSEYPRRLKQLFGTSAVQELNTGPLALVRHNKASLTGSNNFGYPGFFMGARRAYLESYTWWHRISQNLYLDFPLQKRKFPVPAPMDPWSKLNTSSDSIYLDVVIATEFRLSGGTVSSTIEEIKAQSEMGLQTGLFPLYRFDLNPENVWNGKIFELINGIDIHLLVYGQKVHCDLLIVRHPPVLQEHQYYLPYIEANNVIVVVNQTPYRDYNDQNSRLYDVNKCAYNLKRYIENAGEWYPIGPAVRRALKNDINEHSIVKIADNDWVNIIDVDSWSIENQQTIDLHPIIGRHSRDQYIKWPNNKKELLAAYPEDNYFQVKILGGADIPKNILGYIPKNWTVYPFDSINPKKFLSEIDVFVYFTHPGWVESFGRTPLEAMAAGVPVILPETFKPLFKEAAIYATPFEVQDIVTELCQNKDYFEKQGDIGRTFAYEHFGYGKHKIRLAKFVKKLQTDTNLVPSA